MAERSFVEEVKKLRLGAGERFPGEGILAGTKALLVAGGASGEGSSTLRERSHASAIRSQIWRLAPRPNLRSTVRAVKRGFELSEAGRTPVMLQLPIRACHVHGEFIADDNRRPSFTI